jgi:hypothetical protein
MTEEEGRKKGRLRRMGSAVKWAIKADPAHRREHREWVLQELGLARLFWKGHHAGGRIYRIAPGFLGRLGQPLRDPPVVSIAEATHMRDEDVVLGIEVGGSARAYPWWLMDDHHFANDTPRGTPLLIVLCEQCSSGMAFDRTVDDRVLTFRLAYYYNGTISMEDEQTGSVWSPYLGRAIRGRLEGKELKAFPLWQMEWRAWRQDHPDTEVLADGLGKREGHGSDHHIGGGKASPRMWSTVARWDRRLPHNTLVLGVVVAGAVKAYPFEDLRSGSGVVNDEIRGVPVVVLTHLGDGSYGSLAFSRVLAGRVLTFERREREIVDAETGSTWGLDGKATAGPLAGSTLDFLASHVSEWFIWAAHYPGILIGESSSA